MNLPHRKWSYAPAWVDYSIQLANWFEDGINNIVSKLTDWRWPLLEKYCSCERCQQRKRDGLQ